MAEQGLIDEFFQSSVQDALSVLEDISLYCESVESPDELSGTVECVEALAVATRSTFPMTALINKLCDVRDAGGQVSPEQVGVLFSLVLDARSKVAALFAVGV